MAVLDHHDTSSIAANRKPGGLIAVCNLCLVFAALIGLAYIFSLII
jgi:hypothetical protein